MRVSLSQRLHRGGQSGYSAWKEVGMHKAIHSVLGFKSFCLRLTIGLVAFLFLMPIFSVQAQPIPVKDEILGTLIALPDEQLARLVDVAAVLNESEDSIGLFMEAPRDYLLNEGIELRRDAFQITGVNFLLPPAVEEEPWFGIAEPLEDLVFEPKGLGVFYGNVAILIQEASEPVEEGPAVDEISHQLAMLQFISDQFQGETLDLLRVVMRELDELDPEDPRRLEFLANPREYFIGQDLTLPARSYRIIAIDLNRAEAAGSVASDVIRPGLGTVKEGIGVFFNNVGIFLQRAI